jgi:hypothetical protein
LRRKMKIATLGFRTLLGGLGSKSIVCRQPA